jgi:hypothetical protein
MNSGIYFISLKKSAFEFPKGKIIYIGKGVDVDKRVAQELGKRSGPATFFRSIGVLLGKTVIPGSGKNFRFYERKEIADWLEDHVNVRIVYGNPEREKELIRKHRPPLNYTYNAKCYYPGLLELRKKAKEIGLSKK